MTPPTAQRRTDPPAAPARERLSAGAARRIALAAQGLADEPPAERASVDRRHVRRVFRQVGVVQLDSVNVVARAHELTFHARLRHHDRSLPWRLQADGEVFEYWGHEASLVPVEYQPLLRWRMAQADGGAWGGLVRLARERPSYVAQVLEEVRERGPLTTGELSDPGSRSAAWWGWNQGKMALEYLFWSGQVDRPAPLAVLRTGLRPARTDDPRRGPRPTDARSGRRPTGAPGAGRPLLRRRHRQRPRRLLPPQQGRGPSPARRPGRGRAARPGRGRGVGPARLPRP